MYSLRFLTFSFFLVICLNIWPLAVFGQALKPWGDNTHPKDISKEASFIITSGNFKYLISQGGTMDGENCRTPMSVAMDGPNSIPMEKTWESNRSVRMENIGLTDVINPWLSNGRNNFRNLNEIVAQAIENCTTDRDKALGIYWLKQAYRYHLAGDAKDLLDPVKIFNSYGHHACGNDPIILGTMWKAAGFKKVVSTHFSGHAEGQVFYDGRFNFIDGDQNEYILLRDNETIANEAEITHDHDLAKRTHAGGILGRDNRAYDEGYAALFIYDGPPEGDRGSSTGSSITMNMILRPGEAITWRWGHLTPAKYHGTNMPADVLVCNGLWEYNPDITNESVLRKGAVSVSDIAFHSGYLSAESGKDGIIIWKISSPYVFVGGHLEVTGNDLEFSTSYDQNTWKKLSGSSLDSIFPPDGKAYYHYFLRCELTGNSRLSAIRIMNDIQMHSLNLPGMMVGKNNFEYTDENPGGRTVKITHTWIERSVSRPPNAPVGPIYPPDNGNSDNTSIVFKWVPAVDPDKDSISDYHFELSDRADMKFPLSNDFNKLISRTADKGKAQFTLPYPGMVSPEKKYYWRVRAKDKNGVWSKWSDTWSFTAKGPSYPINITMDLDETTGVYTLKWKPNPIGNTPAKYRVYGSDEKGFTISDTDYKVNIGSTEELSNIFPANFVTETTKTELVVIGEGNKLPNANKAYYRVVAVDSKGNRSWSSEYASAPRPFIYSRPVTTANVGREYRYEVLCIRSIGDLQCRENEVKKFYDIENPKFSLIKAPAWLSINPNTGLLSGTPPASKGSEDVIVSVVIEKEVPTLDIPLLGWGNYRSKSSETKIVGTEIQQFKILINAK